MESGFAVRRGQNVVLMRICSRPSRTRDRRSAATEIQPRPVSFIGLWRKVSQSAGFTADSIQLISGRFAMLDDGMGFTLVPWRPVIEKHLGRELTVTVRGGLASWKSAGSEACPLIDRPPEL